MHLSPDGLIRGYLPRRLAVFPVFAESSRYRGIDGQSRHHRDLRNDPPMDAEVRPLRAVIGQDLADLDGRGQLQTAQEIDAAFVRHVAVDVHEDPARGAVDGDEQVTARVLVRHLRQILDVDMDKAWLVVFEGLLGRDGFAFDLWDHVFKARHALALEQACEA